MLRYVARVFAISRLIFLLANFFMIRLAPIGNEQKMTAYLGFELVCAAKAQRVNTTTEKLKKKERSTTLAGESGTLFPVPPLILRGADHTSTRPFLGT